MRIIAVLAVAAALSGCGNPTETQIGGANFNFKTFADNLEKNIQNREVGYAFVVSFQDKWIDMRSGGFARSSDDAPELIMTPLVAFSIASVAKTITAAAALKALYGKDPTGKILFQPIGPYLPPDFNADSNFQNITFAQLLSHTSGIGQNSNPCLKFLFAGNSLPNANDPGNWVDYQTLKSYVTCHPDVTTNTNPLYENTNFALFRFLIPNLLLSETPSPPPANPTSPMYYATAFKNYVQQNIFDPIELYNIPTVPNPPQTGLRYQWPNLAPGADVPDLILSIGSEGWVMSPLQLAKFFREVNFGSTMFNNDKTLQAFVKSSMLNIPTALQQNPPGCMGYDPTYPGNPDLACDASTTWSDPTNPSLGYFYWAKDGNYPGCLYQAVPPVSSGGEFRSKLVLFSNEVSVVLFVNSNFNYLSANPNFALEWPNNTDPCGFKNNNPLWAILDAFNATIGQ